VGDFCAPMTPLGTGLSKSHQVFKTHWGNFGHLTVLREKPARLADVGKLKADRSWVQIDTDPQNRHPRIMPAVEWPPALRRGMGAGGSLQ
jgi:hypothetical protein